MTNFSTEWERAYSSGRGGDRWPWSDLVSYVMRYARPAKIPYRVLELGCAMGANIPFFKELGVEYYGIDGSVSAVEQVRKRFPEFYENIIAGDFTSSIPFSEEFDLIVDRASLTHNTTSAIQQCIKLLKDRLAPDGLFIGIDWFSTEHSDYKSGTYAGDVNTKGDFQEGQFKGIGKTHFSDKAHLESLFKDFVITKLEHKILYEEIPHENRIFAAWNFVAKKEG